MRRLLPSVRDEALEGVYADLVLPTASDRAWLALGMVASVDGGATLGGETAGLGGAADHHAFRALRGACDAVLVGAGTVRAEGYGPASGTPAQRRSRERRGLAPAPRLVIVSGSLDLDPRARAFGNPAYPPLVITHEAASAAKLGDLAAVAEVVRFGLEEVDLVGMLAGLHARGLRRILCEGGPTLNGALLRVDAVDEVFLTVDPVLLGGDAPRIVQSGDPALARRLRIAELREHDGELLIRYQRVRDGASRAGDDG